MNIKKYSGNFEVIDSGTLLAYSGYSDIEFDVQMNEEFAFILVFKFASDGKSEHHLKSQVDDNKITITCINFDNTLGTGTSRPIELAVFEGKKIFINFWVYGLGKKTAREFSYTIYKER